MQNNIKIYIFKIKYNFIKIYTTHILIYSYINILNAYFASSIPRKTILKPYFIDNILNFINKL